MPLHRVGKIILYGCAGILGSVALLMLAVKLALDRAPQYQAQIRDWVHARIGYHVAFAHVSPAFRWYGPELYFSQLELRSKDDARVLARAAGGRVGVDLWRLIRSGKLFAGRVELDSPDISLVRTGPGKFALASEIDIGGGQGSVPQLRLEDLPAGTLAIRRGSVNVQNWNQALPQLPLHDVNLNLSRGDGAVTLAIVAELPAVLGGEVGVQASARGFGLLETLDWTAVAHANGLSLAGWRGVLPQYLTRLDAGTAAFEAAARGRGMDLARVDLNFDATNLVTQLVDGPGVKFDKIGGALTVTHSADRWTVLGRRVRALRAGRRDPDSDFDVTWRGGESGLLEMRARASYLRSETLLPLVGLLPQKDLRERLQELAPTGEWLNTQVEFARATVADSWRFGVQAQFRGVGFAAAGRAPGVKGLNGRIAGNQLGGRVDLDAAGGVFTWPTQFAQPVTLEACTTTLYWRRADDGILVATPSLAFKTPDASVHGPVAWRQPADGGSPLLTLAVSVDNGNVAQVPAYLPRAQLAPSAFAWLSHAFVAGRMPHADVVIQGPVGHFPFRDGAGLFLARARLEGVTLDYREDWPRAENLTMAAEFRNEGMILQIMGGRMGNLVVDKGDARFVDLKTAELKLHAAVTGDAAGALEYLRATPLDGMAEHAFSAVEAHGPMDADVDLFLPFKAFDQRRTLVQAHFHGVSLNLVGATQSATELNGDADIDGAQVSRADVHGRVLGGPFQMQARVPRNRPVTRTTLTFNGTFSGDAAHSALTLPAAIPITGSTDWHGVFRMSPEPSRERILRINGSLAGLALKLPEPLAKPMGRALPSSLEVQWPAGGGAQVRVTLGSVLRAQVALDPGPGGPTVGRAAVTFGANSSADAPAFSDSQVLTAGGDIARLDLAGWLKLYTPDKNAKPLVNFLRSAHFHVAQVDYLGLSYLDLSLDLNITDAGWRIDIGGPNVTGSIAVANAADSGMPWQMEFTRLKFIDEPTEKAQDADAADADADAGTAVGGDSADANPRRIPAINFHAAELVWNERQFGDVQATLAKLDDGVGLTRLAVTGASFTVNAKGEWRGKDRGLARIEGTLTSSDVGGTLKQLGYAAVLEAKTGKMDFDMNWVGAPTEEALKDATGHVQLSLDKGQITGIDPGAGRVVGLASVAALPRRLALDFSDLTDKGLAFDTARGDFDIRDGSAFTDNVLVKGPAAEIGLIGRVGLKNKDYDQTAVVTGNVNSSLPLAAFAAGPVIGGAVLIFTQVFKQPLKGLARGYYRITGNWDNPTVERIKSADATAAAEAPK